MDEKRTIHITIEGTPDPQLYAKAVLGCQTVLAIVGLDDVATVWPDTTIATDQQLGDLFDQWAHHNPWA